VVAETISDGTACSTASGFRCGRISASLGWPARGGPGGFRAAAYFGGNLDNWRLGKGSAVYLPVSVPEALLSIGDLMRHRRRRTQWNGDRMFHDGHVSSRAAQESRPLRRPFADLTYPLIETETDWVLTGFSHPNYLAEFGAKGQSEVYAKSSLDLAMKDAFRKVRRFLMNTRD